MDKNNLQKNKDLDQNANADLTNEHSDADRNDNKNTKTAQLKSVQNIYAAFVASLVLCFAPSFILQTLSFLLFMIVLIWAYVARSRAETDSLKANHMTYIIRTIWIGSVFMTVGIIIAGLWFYQAGDHSVLYSYLEELQGTLQYGTMSDYDPQQIMMDYMQYNKKTLISISVICVGPSFLYFGYRISKGLSRALKGYRLNNVKSWL